ncbi:MAG TPA: type II toxin-antitoxin system VapC family toxin [Gemmataceae bacterium]|nr:type II toxin-antitoxin system VapC family toxin [Gemmataceae bacterium]
MPPFLLDTDHCVAFLQGSHPAHGVIAARLAGMSAADLRISIFSVMELTEGPWHSQTAHGYHAARSALHTFLGWIPTVGLTHLMIEEFGRLRALLRRQNQLIGDLDLAVAATALTHGFTLVTHNQRHFSRIPGLSLEDWFP